MFGECSEYFLRFAGIMPAYLDLSSVGVILTGAVLQAKGRISRRWGPRLQTLPAKSLTRLKCARLGDDAYKK
jgi:hypothetical protein